MNSPEDKIMQQTLRYLRAARTQLMQTPHVMKKLGKLDIDRALQQIDLMERKLTGEAQ